MYMSLIYTCELANHANDVAKEPERWMPWNYTNNQQIAAEAAGIVPPITAIRFVSVFCGNALMDDRPQRPRSIVPSGFFRERCGLAGDADSLNTPNETSD